MQVVNREEEQRERKLSGTRFRARAPRIEHEMEQARCGRFDLIESVKRVEKYRLREQQHQRLETREHRTGLKLATTGLERSLGLGGELLSIEFFEQGLIAARSVGRIVIRHSEFGTGFLVGQNLLMTNHHVLRDPADARAGFFELDYESNHFGERKQSERFEFDPDGFFLTLPGLDMTLVALQEVSEDGRSLAEFGFHALVVEEGKILKGKSVNIIQHPDGREKVVVVHESRFLDYDEGGAADHLCWYSSDTERGSSGSPVFNNRWEVVALHHRAVPKMNARGDYLDAEGRIIPRRKVDADERLIVWVANEGIRVSRLVPGIEDAPLDAAMVERRKRLIELWKDSRLRHPTAGRPRQASGADAAGRESLNIRPGTASAHQATIPPQGGLPAITIHISFDAP